MKREKPLGQINAPTKPNVNDGMYTEEEFWNLVKKIDWPNRGYKDLDLTDYEKSFICKAKTFKGTLQGVLRAKSYKDTGSLFRWPSVSDDSFWDLTAHIVGLGKDVYYDVLMHPEKIEDYLGSYKENFEYCFY